MTKVQDKLSGEIVEVALTRPAVPPKVIESTNEQILGYCGVVVPKRTDVSVQEGTEAKQSLRKNVSALDPEVKKALLLALGVEI